MKKQVHSDIKLFMFELGSNCAYPYPYDVENISMNLIVEAFRLQKVEIKKMYQNLWYRISNFHGSNTVV